MREVTVPLRRYLLLQGPHGPFFRELAKALQQQGHFVVRVSFCLGDLASWPSASDRLYRGHPHHFSDWVKQLIEAEQITDVLLYGDCRPLHQQVIQLKAYFDFRVWVFEEGYLRPLWITFEKGGVNGFSTVPHDFKAWLSQTCLVPLKVLTPDKAQPVGQNFRGVVYFCIQYYMLRTLGFVFFPWYRSHRPAPYFLEAAAWLVKLAKNLTGRKKRSNQKLDKWLASSPRYFFVPLQLDADAQIRSHSPFSSMADFLQVVLSSFAEHAPKETWLVVKPHPLDSELVDYGQYAQNLAQHLGIQDRLLVLYDGALPQLLDCAQGTVTVNSTVGLQSIHHRCPTFCMGEAIYKHPSLTFHGSLDVFWQYPLLPSKEVYTYFRHFLLAKNQINGSFYTQEGRRLLLEAVLTHLQDNKEQQLLDYIEKEKEVVFYQNADNHLLWSQKK